MQNLNTPMMKQYQQIKEKYKDCLLFYRMGDFYELFMEDAYIGAQVLNITLTGKSNGKNGRIPMAGIPYHAVDSYLSKLVKAGYKVAICEQLSPPNKKGLVERDVVRILTPGTVLDERILERKDNNHIVSLDIEGSLLAFSYADISTGFLGTYEVEFIDLFQTLQNELSKLSPVECILPDRLYNDPEILKMLKIERGLNIYPFVDWERYADDDVQFLKNHFRLATLEPFGFVSESFCLSTAAALLGYLKHTQKSEVAHIKKISRVDASDSMVLDRSSMINLELFSTIREHDTHGSLLYVLDRTQTSMGGRLLKTWIKKPLIDKNVIEERLESVEELVKTTAMREQLVSYLQKIPDFERILSRLSVNIGNARDLVNLKNSLEVVFEIKNLLKQTESPLFAALEKDLSVELANVTAIIGEKIVDEPPIDTKNGGMIRSGVNKELDKLRKIVGGSRDWILELEQEERKKTGISSLKIKFNKVFGFYIEVSKANLHLVPDSYMRKQTLVNGERFITPDLKHHEEIILTAEERIKELEFELFMALLDKVLTYTEYVQSAAAAIAVLDCISNFATVSVANNYTRPKILYSGEIRIKQGRHPVVEKLLDEQQFVPNDVVLDNISQQQLLITGPNMAGKSVFIRQVALIVLMAQIGCFVPADSAHISVVDRIFVRSGASDVIASGLSTFMVEMVETAHILNHATKNSLIVMDEIGRGTSTYDGISIAWAVAEYLVSHYKTPPKTLFATHYHELQALEEKYPNKIRNFHMAVADDHGTPIFLHTILPGGASHSFGLAVARLAGVPVEVVEKAQEILKDLENRSTSVTHSESYVQSEEYSESAGSINYMPQTQTIIDHLIHKELNSLDISRLTPLEALNKLAHLKEKIKLIEQPENTITPD